jgi:glycosyltransferase involved in cell wall biosynthesis
MKQTYNRPRIVHVIAGLGAGGTEMMCLRLTRFWLDRFDQSVIALKLGSGALEAPFKELMGEELHIVPASVQSHIQVLKHLRQIIRKDPPDAILIHTFGVHHLVAAAAGRLAGVRVSAAWPGNPPPGDMASRLRWSIVVLASRILRCPIAACSEWVRRDLQGLWSSLPAGSNTIPYGIDIETIATAAADSRKETENRGPVIGMTARLDTIKDHATLLRAFAIVQKEQPAAELWIIGDGTLRHTLEALADELKIAHAVRFLGNRKDVPELLGKFDLYAFSTTRDEGFGIALIEAMAAGVPIVASDVPACNEVLAGGESGVLVPPADPASMARELLRLLRSDDERQAFATRAMARVRHQYSIQICASRWEKQLFDRTSPIAIAAPCAS